MKKLIKKAWIAALLSGKYIQGKSKLRTDDGKYCCLGVLCSISPWKNTYTTMICEEGDPDSNNTYLPRKIYEWAGLPNKNGKLDNEVSLDELNDNYNWNFKEIAQFIKDKF